MLPTSGGFSRRSPLNEVVGLWRFADTGSDIVEAAVPVVEAGRAELARVELARRVAERSSTKNTSALIMANSVDRTCERDKGIVPSEKSRNEWVGVSAKDTLNRAGGEGRRARTRTFRPKMVPGLVSRSREFVACATGVQRITVRDVA